MYSNFPGMKETFFDLRHKAEFASREGDGQLAGLSKAALSHAALGNM